MTNMTISLGRTAKASIGKFVDVLQHMQGFEVKPNRARPKWRTRVLIFYTKHRLFSALRHVLSLMVSPFASVNKGACIEANPSTHVGFPIVDVGRMDNLLSCTNGAPWTSKRSVAHPNSSAVDADSQEASMPISSENLVPQKWRPLQFDPISGIKFQAQAHSESQPLCIHGGFSKMCLRPAPKIPNFMALTRFDQPKTANSCNKQPNNQPTGHTQLEWWSNVIHLVSAKKSLTSAMLSFQLPTRQWGRSLECESGQAKALETFQTQTSLGMYLSVVVDSHKAKKTLCKLRTASLTHSWPECFKTLHINQFRKYNRFCQQESLPGKERTGWDSHWKLPFHIVGLHKVLNENDMDLFLRVK